MKTSILILFCFALSVQASTNSAATASLTDVQSAVDLAARGDTVLVPSGTVTWSASLNITKGIYLIGSGTNATKITTSGGATAINISPDATAISSEETIMVSGFRIDGGGSSLVLVSITGAGAASAKPFKNLIIGNNLFRNNSPTTSNNGVIYNIGQTRGVIYSNVFENCDLIMKALGNDSTTEWSNGNFPQSYGRADQLFFEGNYIYWSSGGTWQDPGWNESGQGGRLVMRYNQWNMANVTGSEIWDIHGFQYNPGGQTGTMCSEYYGNSIVNGSGYRWVHHRSPWGMYFNNTFSGSSTPSIEWGEYSGSCYADLGSPNYNPEITNSYCWNNTVNGSQVVLTYDGADNFCGVSENRNWYNYTSSFNGSVGVGTGTSAPGGAATIGVGFWQASTATPTTDPAVIQNGVFWKATATDTWEAYYSPYTFPHPLSSSSGGAQPPSSGGTATATTVRAANTFVGH